VKDLLLLLGKRVHDLRIAKGWSQEEFAHICGVHRTYAGQIERGEKNLSFGNLLKIAAALSITVSELLSGLEDGGTSDRTGLKRKRAGEKNANSEHRILEIQRLVKRLSHQRTEMDRTIILLEDLMAGKRGKR
jgi:transcriptional regulator with XRE-family HTH domain